MCKCVNVEIGSYDNQVQLPAPSWSSKDFICVDKCLEKEILFLWSQGVVTGGCCCGHNRRDGVPPFIQVYPESEMKMLELGYYNQNNESNIRDFGCYYPKTVGTVI